MKRILLLITLAAALLGGLMAHAQNGVAVWTNRFNGPGNGGDYASAVAVGTNGNVIVTGISTGTNGGWDFATIKYSGAGVPLWTNYYDGPESYEDSPHAVAVDGSGNVFVTGQSFSAGSSWDFATIKYSAAGVPLWTNRYNGPSTSPDVPVAMTTDASGNVFVTGYSYLGGGGIDYTTIKYSEAGVALWTRYYNGPGDGTDAASAMALDSNGNVLVTGASGGGIGALADFATIKYSNDGVPLWTNRFNGPGNSDDEATAIAVDPNGNVFVTGHQTGSSSFFDYATIKYSNAGVPLWTNRYAGLVTGTDVANAIALDTTGNAYVTGYSGNGFSTDYATIKYSGAGVPLWTNRYNGPANNSDLATAITVDTSGHVFVTGYSRTSSNTYHYSTIAYTGAGVALWTNRNHGSGSNPQQANAALAADRSGNVFMTGYSLGLDSDYDYLILKYSIARPSLTIARTTTNTVAISWPSPSTGFTLQQNTNGIATVNWSNVLTTPTDNGTKKTVIVNPPGGTRFYRLSNL
jgi:uncharacterized delta-60 repeat protein